MAVHSSVKHESEWTDEGSMMHDVTAKMMKHGIDVYLKAIEECNECKMNATEAAEHVRWRYDMQESSVA